MENTHSNGKYSLKWKILTQMENTHSCHAQGKIDWNQRKDTQDTEEMK